MLTHKKKNGQSIVEYVVVFTVIVMVVIGASFFVLRPSVNGLYQRTAETLDTINPTLDL